MIQLLIPAMPPSAEAMAYFKRSEEAKRYSNFGPCVQELERRLSERYDGAHIITVSSCATGLNLVYTQKMIEGYKAIELPALTFPATWLEANRSGLAIKPIDVHQDTWVAPGVAGFGVPTVGPVVDAAGAFGEQKVPKGMIAVFSMHATKSFGIGEGGFIVCHDRFVADELRKASNFGIDGGVSVSFGTNGKMSELSAAMGLASLDAWDREAWLQLGDWYDKHLPACVVNQKRPRGAYTLLPVKLPCDAQTALERMKELGVECRRWYVPLLVDHPLFVEPGINRAERRAKKYDPLPVSRDLEQHLLGLPYHLFLKESDVRRVCEALEQCVTETVAA